MSRNPALGCSGDIGESKNALRGCFNHLWKRPLPLSSIQSNRTAAPDSGTPVTFQRQGFAPGLMPPTVLSKCSIFNFLKPLPSLRLPGSEPQTFGSKSIISCGCRLGDLPGSRSASCIPHRSGSAGSDLHIHGAAARGTRSRFGEQGCIPVQLW